MKKKIRIAVGLCLAAVFVCVAVGAEDDDEPEVDENGKKIEYGKTVPKGNPKYGKHLYKKTCRVCHNKKNRKNKARELSPKAKTRAQWERFLRKKKHDKDVEPDIIKDLWEQKGQKDLKSLWRFLYDGALDSRKPQGCG